MIGVGAKVEYESGSSWTEIPHVKQVINPPVTVGQVETTHLGVTNMGRTYEPGMIDPGVLTIEAAYDPTVYGELFGMLREPGGWRVSDPDGGKVVTCDGYISSLNVQFQPTDDEVMISIQVRMTGVPAVA